VHFYMALSIFQYTARNPGNHQASANYRVVVLERKFNWLNKNCLFCKIVFYNTWFDKDWLTFLPKTSLVLDWKGVQDIQDVKGVKDIQDVKDVKDVEDVKDVKDAQDVKDVKDVEDVKDAQDGK
jgi:uncharacterized protein YbcV (DUF1398 family)